jgi:hypothetical protein
VNGPDATISSAYSHPCIRSVQIFSCQHSCRGSLVLSHDPRRNLSSIGSKMYISHQGVLYPLFLNSFLMLINSLLHFLKEL